MGSSQADVEWKVGGTPALLTGLTSGGKSGGGDGQGGAGHGGKKKGKRLGVDVTTKVMESKLSLSSLNTNRSRKNSRNNSKVSSSSSNHSSSSSNRSSSNSDKVGWNGAQQYFPLLLYHPQWDYLRVCYRCGRAGHFYTEGRGSIAPAPDQPALPSLFKRIFCVLR